jgi:multidrug efflux pump subunit AcrB
MYVDTTNEYRKTMSVEEALTLAGKSRLRPILMTTMTTVLSMVPMVIPGAGGDPSMRGLAYVIIGGLGMATILTLIILPVFYLFVCKKDPKTSQPDDTEKKEPAKLPELQEISLD